MSGLLVKSTVVMRENLEEMSRQGLEIPVLLGGAALTRNYVEDDCVRAYACGRVAYARDAFDGLHLMDKVTGNAFDDYLAAIQAKRVGKARNPARTLGQADARAFRRSMSPRCRRAAGADADVPVPEPPFWGARVIEAAPKAIVPFVERALPVPVPVGFPQARPLPGGLPGLGRAGAAAGDAADAGDSATSRTSSSRRPPTAIGRRPARATTWSCSTRTAPPSSCRFTLPRQPKENGECIADFFRDVDEASVT